MHIFDLQELETATNNFSPSRLIGKGSHGSVYRGVLNNNKLIAIKKQSSALQKLQDNTKLENEASVLSSIPPDSCPIINLLGISHDKFNNKIIVTQYMPNGTLHDNLHVSNTPPSWPKRIEIAVQIAKGVQVLHESNPPIVHRDIKSTNILFDEMHNSVLADFGLAIKLDSGVGSKLPAGTIGYIDPSYTTPSKLSTKIDVFSYGVVLLELICGRKAMDVSKSPPSIVEWALPLIERGRAMEVCDERVHLPRYVARAIKQLSHVAARCLSFKESVRPTMGEIVGILEDLTVGSIQLPLSMNYFRDIIVNLIGRRMFRFDGTRMMINKASDTCADDHDRGSGVTTNNSICKGTLLVREILADITLK